MIAIVSTADGVFAVDLDTEEVEPYDGTLEPVEVPILNLPRLVAAAAAGATVLAVVDTKPPLVVSHDAGTTWRESAADCPPGGRSRSPRRTPTPRSSPLATVST